MIQKSQTEFKENAIEFIIINATKNLLQLFWIRCNYVKKCKIIQLTYIRIKLISDVIQ